MLEKQAKIAYIGIGSNLGNKKKNIELSKYSNLEIFIIVRSYKYSNPWMGDKPTKERF